MPSVRRAAERTLRSIGDEKATAATKADIALRRPLKRMGLTAIDSVTRSQPELVAAALRIPTYTPTLDRIDSGMHSSVYRLDETSVLKIVNMSVFMSARKRRYEADKMREEHAAFRSFIGHAVVPQEIQVGPHPFKADREAITITQPYCEIDYLQLGEEDPTKVPEIASRLEHAKGRLPHIVEEVTTMVRNSRILSEDRHLTTDILGINNMGLESATGNFMIIDGQPVDSHSRGLKPRIDSCFENLEAALQLAA